MQKSGYSKSKGLRCHFWPNKATSKASPGFSGPGETVTGHSTY